jgi:threonine dehydrogenase-like Zn-dependent dehydrogenase
VVSLVGVPSEAAAINGAAWLVKEVRLTTSLGYQREEFELTQALVTDGRLQLSPLHTSTVALNRIGAAFQDLTSGAAQVKVLVNPNG